MDSNKFFDNDFGKKLDDFRNNLTNHDDDLVEFNINDMNDQNTEGESEEETMDNDNIEKSAEDIRLVDYSDSSADSQSEDEFSIQPSSREKPKRIIAYSTKKLLKIFDQRKCSGDGTFKICPSLWKQLYIVMVKFGNSWIPVIYALLPDKCKETYFAFFYMVKKQIKDMKLDFNLQSIITDFEVGAMKAAAVAWKVAVKGCYYHFTQAGWRFVQNNNMASAYLSDNDQEFKLLIRSVLSLPHVPLNDIEETIQLIDDKDWNFGDSPEKHEFKDKMLTIGSMVKYPLKFGTHSIGR